MRRILITGASGFLGKYLVSVLSEHAELVTLGRSATNKLVCDLGVTIPKMISSTDLVIHAAGKAHLIPRTPLQVEEFFLVNYQATVNLMKGLENVNIPKAFVFISTVAVYGVEAGEMISEAHPLNGASPYAKSKIQAEEFVTTWCSKNNVKLTILRLPLVVGSRPPGNLGIIVKWMSRKLYLGIGKGDTKKSMVLAEDVAQFIPHVAFIGGIFNLTDGFHPTVHELEKSIAEKMNQSEPSRLPKGIVKFLATMGDFFGSWFPINSMRYRKLTSNLTFSDTKARELAGWKSHSVIDHLPNMK